MDDLDRLYHELVDSMRRQRPAALLKPVAVFEVHELLVPYRRVRNALGFRSNDDYEAALSRMLAGERGYLFAEGELQPELQAGLGELVADIRRYRSYPEARVWLNPEKIPPPGDIRYAPPAVRERTDWARAAVDENEAASDTGEAGPTADPQLDSAAPEGYEETIPDDVSADEATSDRPDGETTDKIASAGSGACPECAEPLPETAVFCPFCGFPVSGECGSCGAPLEPTWRYCAACGRPRG